MAETPAPNGPLDWPPPSTGEARVVLVRHGRTAWNASGRFLGRTDLPLDEVGEAEATAAGERLRGRFDAIWSSPLVRAVQTAQRIGPLAGTIEGMAELDQGALEGLDVHEAVAAHPEFFAAWGRDPTHVRVPGGESMGELVERAEAALVALDPPPGAVIAVVTHQMVIAALCCRAAGVPLTRWRRHTVPNLATVALGVRSGALHLPASAG